MITASQGQVLFNTTSQSIAYSDGVEWFELPSKSDLLNTGFLQLPHVSEQGDRLYLGNGKYVIIPGISVAQLASISDPEGNTYGTFCYTFGIAGTQYCWMTENLRATKYNDGTPIPNGNAIANITTPANSEWVFDYNNNPLFAPTYGKLYSHEVVKNTKNVCPVGYSVPSQQDWLDLISWLAGNTPSFAGKEAVALKAMLAGWNSSSSAGGTEIDFYGFNILPSGFRAATAYGGQFDQAKFWSSTSSAGNNAVRASLSSINNIIDIASEFNNQGMSIRCLQKTP